MGEAEPETKGTLALASSPGGMGDGGHKPPDPQLNRSIMTVLGQVLRNDYDRLTSEPIPEALLALLPLPSGPAFGSKRHQT